MVGLTSQSQIPVMGMATLSLLVIFCFIRGVMPAADLKIFYLYVSKYLLFVTIKGRMKGGLILFRARIEKI